MSTAASIALILLIIEALIFAIVFLMLVGSMVYGMSRLLGAMKRVLPRGQEVTTRIQVTTRQISDRVAAPFIWAHAMNAKTRAVGKSAKQRVASRF